VDKRIIKNIAIFLFLCGLALMAIAYRRTQACCPEIDDMSTPLAASRNDADKSASVNTKIYFK
jgi:hypothetical protein